MGAVKIPEQVEERRSECLSWGGDIDPLIKELLSKAVQVNVAPEEHNRRRQPSAGALKGTNTIYRKMAYRAQIKALLFKIDAMQGDLYYRDMPHGDRLKAQLAIKRQVRDLRIKIGGRRR